MKRITLTLLCAFGLSALLAQSEDAYQEAATRAFLDIVPEFEVGLPVGEFAADLNQDALVGKGIGVYYRFARQPLDFGVRFTGFTYDKMQRNYTDSLDDFKAFEKTKNKIWLLQGVLRFEPPLNTSTILFLEGAAGWRRFYSKSYSRERGLVADISGSEEGWKQRFNRITHNSDWGTAVSAAVGAKFILEHARKTALEIKLCYHWGVSGDFLVRNDLSEVQEDPLENLEEHHAPLTMFAVKIGLSFLAYQE